MLVLPEVINVGNPYIPSQAEYLLRPIAQKEIPESRHSAGTTTEAIFKVWIQPHQSYPPGIIPFASHEANPGSGKAEDIVLVSARFNYSGEVEKAKAVSPIVLPLNVRRRNGIVYHS